MTIAVYTIGPSTPPPIKHDSGFLDRFPRRAPTSEDWLRLSRWVITLELGEGIQRLPWVPHNDLSDALAAYRHFLFGNGKDRSFSYERYVSMDPSGQKTLHNAILDACMGAEQLYESGPKNHPVQFQMTGTALICGDSDPRFPYPETENWQKTIGGHAIWLSGTVDVSNEAAAPSFQIAAPFFQTAAPFFQMVLTLHAEDRYNFKPDAQDIATGIPDSDNGVFEVTGLAQQYMHYSSMVRLVRWYKRATTNPTSTNPDPGRKRHPQDNHRVRNRI
ncbi:hypothetical protein WME99_47620 [Sorangium sp. So ce136]|uniref:hypothetical protein n=1 Tax=Sorangium sp. So ce136 TaxID=3133284 RepID=UPI003F04BE33